MVGDIGAKFSPTLNGADNGYLMFDHVRIPLDQMLMGLAKVKNKPVIAKLTGKFHNNIELVQLQSSLVFIIWQTFLVHAEKENFN